MPSWELFEQQPPHYRDEVLGPGTLHIAIEAAAGFGWDRWIEPGADFIGMRGFGASAPAKELFEKFGITPTAVVESVKTRISQLRSEDHPPELQSLLRIPYAVFTLKTNTKVHNCHRLFTK